MYFTSYLIVTSFLMFMPPWQTKHDDVIKWKHFSALLAICAGNSRPAQRPLTRSFDVFFDLRRNKWLSKQWWGWWFETLCRPLWRHCNDNIRMAHSEYFVCWSLWWHSQLKTGKSNVSVYVCHAFKSLSVQPLADGSFKIIGFGSLK